MKKLLSFILIVLVLSLLVGCGQDKNSAAPTPAQTKTKQTATPSNDSKTESKKPSVTESGKPRIIVVSKQLSKTTEPGYVMVHGTLKNTSDQVVSSVVLMFDGADENKNNLDSIEMHIKGPFLPGKEAPYQHLVKFSPKFKFTRVWTYKEYLN